MILLDGGEKELLIFLMDDEGVFFLPMPYI